MTYTHKSKTDEYINLGYEGIIIRDLTADYQFGKRNKSMMKLKGLLMQSFKLLVYVHKITIQN
jgi:ATP-dependent DNA ligase